MPNWCHNTLTVTGEAELLQRFVAAARPTDAVIEENYRTWKSYTGEQKPTLEEYRKQVIGMQPLSFESFKPMPASESENWYEWNIANWGTKWDASFGQPFIALGDEGMDPEKSAEAHGVTDTPTVAVYKFDTAWTPPIPVLQAMSDQHTELEFVLRFAEVGNDYAGEMKWVSGVLIDEEELKVTEVLAPEEMWF